MKSMFARSLAAILCVATLASCGGGSGTLYLNGVVYGLVREGLVLANNGGSDLAVLNGAGTFVFNDLVASDEQFNVTVKTQPTNEICTVTLGSGKANGYNSSQVVVTCVLQSKALGGVITGLTGTGLVLINGSTTYSPAAGTTNFVLGQVGEGNPYGVTVLSQPSGQSCTVANGNGYMGLVDINPLQVTCVNT